MKTITVRRLDLQFDAGQITDGTYNKQADQAIELINEILQRQPFGLGAQLIAHPDEIEVEEEDGQVRSDQQAEHSVVPAGIRDAYQSPQIQQGGGHGVRTDRGNDTGEVPANRPASTKCRKNDTMKYYVLIMWGDIEPQLTEAFTTEETRDQHARDLRKEHGNDHGIFPLDVDENGKPEVGAYSGGFFMEKP
jgi:hypothetical protein